MTKIKQHFELNTHASIRISCLFYTVYSMYIFTAFTAWHFI